MISDGKAASAVGGKTARACDSCARRRARWFCAADDAFLCQLCDTTVHAANRLANRHERVRLQTSSLSTKSKADVCDSPKWLTRKPRTPRSGKVSEKAVNLFDLPFVPELSKDEGNSPTGDRTEEEGIHRVPVFDSMAVGEVDYDLEFDHQIQGFLQSEIELAEFTADMASLLGMDDRCLNHEVKGFDFKEEDEGFFNLEEFCVGEERVKVEEDESLLGFEENPNCGSEFSPETAPAKRDILLTLNYEAVIAAWDSHGSPWMTGVRPEVKLESGWPDCMDTSHGDFQQKTGNWRGGDGGREARVSRYREKRRVRLFSKKIRYEVRKLNAEKRPRMKGRFVKRTSLMPTTNTNNTTIPSSTSFPNYNFMKK